MSCFYPKTRVVDGVRKVFPCGTCPACLKRKRNDWRLRFEQELKYHESSSFVTLTFDEIHAKRNGLGWTVLDKQDIILFMKRFRKHFDSQSFKFYCIGEYGSKFGRAHYHIFFFGIDNYDAYPILMLEWRNGNVRCTEVNGNRIGYMSNFHVVANRKWNKQTEQPPEFTLNSKGLGKPSSNRMKSIKDLGYVQAHGLKFAIPRYWFDMLPEDIKLVWSDKAQNHLLSEIDREKRRLEKLTPLERRIETARKDEQVRMFKYKTRKNRK